MDTKTKEMIKGWIKTDGKEGAAKFLSNTIRCGIKEARRIVEEAAGVAYEEVIKRAISRHVATVTGHRRECRCTACCQARVRGKRYARRMGWLQVDGPGSRRNAAEYTQ